MKTINKAILVITLILALSCDDVFEKDITDTAISATYPPDNVRIESNVVNFRWNGLQGATKYRIQIYGANQAIVLDSLSSKTDLTYPLSPGNYQWKVRGENSAYQSQYSTVVNFSTATSSNLTNQQVVLSSPQNEIYVNYTSIPLSWQALPNATSYSIEVINVANSQQVYADNAVTGTSIVLNASSFSNGKYEWRVKAKNSTTETLVLASRKFNIDTVIPNPPQNSNPLNNTVQIINQPIPFSWTVPIDPGNNQPLASYTIEFSNDLNFTTIIQTSNANANSFQQTFSVAGNYFWRVKAKDAASNTSLSSAPYKFVIN